MRRELRWSQGRYECLLYAIAGAAAGCVAAVVTIMTYATWHPRVIAWWTQASEQVAQLN